MDDGVNDDDLRNCWDFLHGFSCVYTPLDLNTSCLLVVYCFVMPHTFSTTNP
jgi:hypothetical protein